MFANSRICSCVRKLLKINSFIDTDGDRTITQLEFRVAACNVKLAESVN